MASHRDLDPPAEDPPDLGNDLLVRPLRSGGDVEIPPVQSLHAGRYQAGADHILHVNEVAANARRGDPKLLVLQTGPDRRWNEPLRWFERAEDIKGAQDDHRQPLGPSGLLQQERRRGFACAIKRVGPQPIGFPQWAIRLAVLERAAQMHEPLEPRRRRRLEQVQRRGHIGGQRGGSVAFVARYGQVEQIIRP